MQTVEQLCRQLASGDQVKIYQAKQELVKRTSEAGAPGQDRQRTEMATTMAALVAAQREAKDDKGKATKVPELSAQGRSLIARYLAQIGGDDEVPALRAAMQDFDVRDMARWALARMTCSAATAALVEAATNGIGNEFRIGAIQALADRSGDGVVESLRTCLADPTPEIRVAAVEALARHPDPAADEWIMKATVGGGRQTKRVVKARLRLAEQLVAAGQKDAARKIYQSIAAGKYDAAQKKAAGSALTRLG